MFQFAFAKGYAEAMGCDLQTNDWWGRQIFPVAAEIPLIDRKLRSTFCDSLIGRAGMPPLGYFIGATDIDLFGYFQHQIFLDFYSRQQVREWFKLLPELDLYSPRAVGLTAKFPYSVKHLRRGDYTSDPTFRKLYCTVSDESYDKAVEQFNIPAPMPVFDGWDPPAPSPTKLGVPWLQDWLILRDADYLLRSNSTFAWWAATLGHGKVYSPVVENRVGLQQVAFIEGNWPNTAGVFPNQSDLRLKET